VLTVTVQGIDKPAIWNNPVVCTAGKPSVLIQWTAATCGTTYKLYSCDATVNGAGCDPNVLLTTTASTTFTDSTTSPNPLVEGHQFRYKVRAYKGAYFGPFSEVLPVNIPVCPQCTITMYDLSPEQGSTETETVTVEPFPQTKGGNVTQVLFSILSGASDISLIPITTNPVVAPNAFKIDVLGINQTSTAKIQGLATMNDGVTTCSATANVTVSAAHAWWQSIGGDVISGGQAPIFCRVPSDCGTYGPCSGGLCQGVSVGTGDINSTIPAGCGTTYASCAPYMIKAPSAGNDTGIPIAEGQNITTGTGFVSASSPIVQAVKVPYITIPYSYTFFENKFLANLTPPKKLLTTSTLSNANSLLPGGSQYGQVNIVNGYRVYITDSSINGGDLTFDAPSTMDFANYKVIVFVTGKATIVNPIRLTNGRGFFMIVSKGDIDVDPTVGGNSPDLEGIYYTDGKFNTGGGNQQLYVRGSIAAMGTKGTNDGLNLTRDLTNNAQAPAEIVEYAPDLLLNYPPFLGIKSIDWKEVAP